MKQKLTWKPSSIMLHRTCAHSEIVCLVLYCSSLARLEFWNKWREWNETGRTRLSELCLRSPTCSLVLMIDRKLIIPVGYNELVCSHISPRQTRNSCKREELISGSTGGQIDRHSYGNSRAWSYANAVRETFEARRLLTDWNLFHCRP